MTKYWILLLLFPCLTQAQMPGAAHELYFEATKASLSDSAQRVLAAFAKTAKTQSDQRIYIKAHTDNVGSKAENEILAARRADTVQAYLQDQGLEAAGMQIAALGEAQPVVPNTSAANRQRNRRVEVGLMPAAAGTLVVKIRSAESQKGIPATLKLSENEESYPITIGPSGEFSTSFAAGTSGLAEVQAKGHFFASENWAVEENDTTTLRFNLQPIEQDAALELKIFFYGGRSTILPKSYPELRRLKDFVQKNKALQLEIAGHVNVPNTPPVPQNSEHYELSESRAQVIKDYLLEQGVEPSRITAKGYGNSQMLFPEAVAEEEQARNRRVEVRITGLQK